MPESFEDYCGLVEGQFLVGSDRQRELMRFIRLAFDNDFEPFAAVEIVSCWMGLGPAMSRAEAIAQAQINLMRAEMVAQNI